MRKARRMVSEKTQNGKLMTDKMIKKQWITSVVACDVACRAARYEQQSDTKAI